jgi:hypothetical protein
MPTGLRGGLRLMLMAGAVAAVPASGTAQETKSAPPQAAQQEAPETKRLDLSDAQRETIFNSITNQNFKNEAPPNFQPRLGLTVPVEIQLEEVPRTIVQLVPVTETYRVARILNLVVFVDPMDRRVVAVISGNPQ